MGNLVAQRHGVLDIDDVLPWQNAAAALQHRAELSTACGKRTLAAQLLQGRFEIFPIWIVITDVMLPDFPGLQVVEAVRMWHPQVRVLVMSGSLSEQVAGAASFLQKPFTAAQLRARVREVLHSERPGTLQD